MTQTKPIAEMTSKEYYEFQQEQTQALGLPRWTTYEELAELLDSVDE